MQRKTNNILTAVSVVALIAFGGSLGYLQFVEDPNRQSATVVRIVDGDTLWVQPTEPGLLPTNASTSIRLLLIDTPETKHPTKPIQCWGPEATQTLSTILPVGTAVELEADRAPEDRYGRALRHVYQTNMADSANEIMLRMGAGVVRVYAPNRAHEAEYRRAEETARSLRRGLWGNCPAPITPPVTYVHNILAS